MGYTLNAGTGNTVVLVDQGDGYVIADAIKVVPENAAPNTATWTPTIPSSGSYKVYARWTAHPNRASDAKYTVTHAGGDTVVTADQVQNNGQWVLLGTFNMAPSSGHKVSLTDQANGYVIADAIRLLEASAPEYNTATWTPNAAAGQYEVYAKWTASGNRASNATYTVNHAQGSTPVTVNQQANGGAFNLLGTFNLNSGSTITLGDNANGYVIADAIQLIALTTVPKMYFVHTDHLNTPRLISSDTGQAVWSWANDDPYGNNAPNENPAGAGQFTCNLRLPGQYFDSELNTHYNYFRDYDPLTGRYVQSDPIGLAGGINTYAYVSGMPLNRIDPNGLIEWNGNFSGVSVSDVVGAAVYTFDLTSECVSGYQANAKGVAFGGTAGIGVLISGSTSTATFIDHETIPNPAVFNGSFSMFNAGASFGTGRTTPNFTANIALTAAGRRPSPNGIGYNDIFLGGARSKGVSNFTGFDASISFTAGSSIVTSSSIKPCGCK